MTGSTGIPLSARFGAAQAIKTQVKKHYKRRQPGRRYRRKGYYHRKSYNRFFRQDERSVFRNNNMNTGKFFTGKARNGRSKRPFNQRRPVANHQNQGGAYNGVTFTEGSYYRGRRMAQKSPYNGGAADATAPVETELLGGVHYPISTYFHTLKSDTPDVLRYKRTMMFEKSMLDFTRNVATGWYAGIRKSCIRFGPTAQNDKYFVNLVMRNSGTPADLLPTATKRYNAFVSNHTLMINFLQNLLIANFNYIIMNDTVKLLTRLPQHIAFALNVAAKKYIMRVRNGATNLATRLPSVLVSDSGLGIGNFGDNSDPCYFDSTSSVVNLLFVPPTSFISGGLELAAFSTQYLVEIPAMVNYLFAVQQHDRYPYNTVDEIQTTLPGLTHYDSNGVAIKVELHIDEIVSVFGYAAQENLTTQPGFYLHDLSGLEQTKISGIYRSMYFCQFDVEDPSEYYLIPDDFNDRINTNYYFDNYQMAVYFGLTSVIPQVDYMLTGQMPFGLSRDDLTFTKVGDGAQSTITNSKVLNYFTTKYDSNNTRPAPFKATTRAVPTFPTVTFAPEAYQLANAMAQKMQNRYFDFIVNPLPSFLGSFFSEPASPVLSPLLSYQRAYFSMEVEVSFSVGVWVLQYDARFVLPSPIIEDYKPYNSYNTWTYKGGSQSVGIQLHQLNLARAPGSLAPGEPGKKNPGGIISSGNLWIMKVGQKFTADFNYQNEVGNSSNCYVTYSGIVYSPQNFDAILESHNNAMNEIRPYVKLNNCPEYELALPSMHTLYAAYSDAVSNGQDPTTAPVAIYTPLSADNYTSKNIAIFVKVAQLPFIQLPANINIPMLNVTNIAQNLFGTPAYQERALFNLTQYSFVANYTGQASELDFYYEQLRKHMIGSWSDLAPLMNDIENNVGAAKFRELPDDSKKNRIINMLNTYKRALRNAGSKMKQTGILGTKNISQRMKNKKAFSGLGGYALTLGGQSLYPTTEPEENGIFANGDFKNMMNTILKSIGNYDEDGSVSANTSKSKGKSDFFDQIIPLAMKSLPMILEAL